MFTALREGLRWFRTSRLLVTFATLAGVINFSTAAVLAILVLFSQDRLGLNDAGFGLLLAIEAIGGIPAGFLASAIIRRLGEAAVMVLSTLSAGLGYLAIALSENVWVVGAVMVIVGFGFTLGNVVAITVRQTIVPGHMFGRVLGISRTFTWGIFPFATLLGGWVARIDLRLPFLIAAGVTFVATLFAVRLLLSASRHDAPEE